MAFDVHDLDALTATVAAAWRTGLDRDWSRPAGTLDWSCRRTADHVADTLLAPAFFLASRRQDDYPPYGVATAGPSADPAILVEAVQTAARILGAVVAVTDPDVTAVIWRRPAPERRGPADFVPRGGLELALHAHDVCAGIGVEFRPPEPVSEHLRDHTRDWPHWTSPGWRPLDMTGDAWDDLLRSSGRAVGPAGGSRSDAHGQA